MMESGLVSTSDSMIQDYPITSPSLPLPSQVSAASIAALSCASHPTHHSLSKGNYVIV